MRALLLTGDCSVEVKMSGGSSRGKEKGKGAMKGNPFVWEGPLGPKDFEEAIYDRFLLESKHDFTKEAPLRAYDDRKEEWPKCMHGEDCLVQMYTEGTLLRMCLPMTIPFCH